LAGESSHYGDNRKVAARSRDSHKVAVQNKAEEEEAEARRKSSLDRLTWADQATAL
jgi:hypothetical protein